jgi:hypothetical protein
MKETIRMNQLAGIITEGQAKKMIEVLNENILSNALGGIVKRIPLSKEILFQIVDKSIEEIKNVFKTEYTEDQAKEFIKVLRNKILDREVKTINDLVILVQAEKDKVRK